MPVSPTYKLSGLAAAIGVPPRRCQFLVKEGVLQPVGGGGSRGSHWQFSEHEPWVGRLAVTLQEAGVVLSSVVAITYAFRTNWLLADPPRLVTGQSIDDVHSTHKKWRKRIQAALRGNAMYLLVSPPISEGEPGDLDAAHLIDLVTPQELGKVILGTRFGSRKVVTVVALNQIWAGL